MQQKTYMLKNMGEEGWQRKRCFEVVNQLREGESWSLISKTASKKQKLIVLDLKRSENQPRNI